MSVCSVTIEYDQMLLLFWAKCLMAHIQPRDEKASMGLELSAPLYTVPYRCSDDYSDHSQPAFFLYRYDDNVLRGVLLPATLTAGNRSIWNF